MAAQCGVIFFGEDLRDLHKNDPNEMRNFF
jgi:hypothetical protein